MCASKRRASALARDSLARSFGRSFHSVSAGTSFRTPRVLSRPRLAPPPSASSSSSLRREADTFHVYTKDTRVILLQHEEGGEVKAGKKRTRAGGERQRKGRTRRKRRIVGERSREGMISKDASTREESGVVVTDDCCELERRVPVRERRKIRRIYRPISRQFSRMSE